MNINEVLKTVELAVEEILNPSSKDMRALKEKITNLLSENEILDFEKNKIQTIQPSKKKPHSIVPNESRCEALICDLEMINNKLMPARCKRSMLENSKYCKQHGGVDGKVNQEDSEYFGKEIIHDYKWGHLGTIHSPSYIFEKYHDILVKKYNAKNNINKIETNEICHENNVKHSIDIKKEKITKSKRTIANAFITFKSDNFATIKSSILANNSNITGRDLVVAITKEASERWKSISEQDKAMYKKKALANKTAVSKPVTLLIHSDTEEEEIVIPNVEEFEEETTLVFNSIYNIWVDTDNNLCYESNNNTLAPLGQLQRGKMTIFPKKQ